MNKHEIVSWLKSLLIAFGIAMVIRVFLFSPYYVEGASMDPTLHDEEKIFVNKFEELDRGDIVIIKGEEKNYVKRLIGFPGDELEMKDDHLYINGKQWDEDYLSENRKEAEGIVNKLTGDFGPLTVPEDHYFVMGDNRLVSLDSRNGLGYIEKERIIGVSEFVWYPFSNVRKVD
ncbi:MULTISPECIES: signal peptidase I [Cytobacillus]|uniref:signal peptidase I n=1 Tax=Cytobacillus TaxID=2675230 RepID=UPI0025424FD6|nr:MULTISPECIES: signal peptidase I [Cytobacillus]MBY0156528.1 signal peptidase I [Cytobacillus firmus]